MKRSSLALVLLSAASAVTCSPQAPLEKSGADAGTGADAETRVVVSPVVSVAIGAAHACAVRRDGTITCVGSNDKGQATPPPGLFYQVVAGEAHTCGQRMVLEDRTQDMTLVCWGDNTYGQLAAPPGPFDEFTAGGRHNCGRWIDKVTCWGDNSHGQSTMPPGLSSVGEVRAGRNHTCAIGRASVNDDTQVLCWGDNSRGQSTPPADARNVSFLAAGGDHTCAGSLSNYLACWGDNEAGQSIAPVGFIRGLSVAAGHSCGLFDWRIRCWGTDWGTALATPPVGLFNHVFAGDYLNCALPIDAGSPLLCWGQSHEPWY